MNRLFFALFALLLSACQHAPYIASTDANSATLNIHDLSTAKIGVVGFNNAEDCSGGQFVIHPEFVQHPRNLSTKLSPNKVFSFYVIYHRFHAVTQEYVRQPITFFVEPNKTYDLVFDDSQITKQYGISLTSKEGGKSVPVESAKFRRWKTPMFEGGSFCE